MSDWIKVEDRLPEEGQHVIACVWAYSTGPGRVVTVSTFHDGEFMTYTEEDDEEYVGDRSPIYPPTHWQPLPSPPTE